MLTFQFSFAAALLILRRSSSLHWSCHKGFYLETSGASYSRHHNTQNRNGGPGCSLLASAPSRDLFLAPHCAWRTPGSPVLTIGPQILPTFLDTESHVAQDGLELLMGPRMTLNS